jgi:hypothetical protein
MYDRASLSSMVLAIRMKLCSILYVLCIHDSAWSLGSLWSPNTCYVSSACFHILWTWFITTETWKSIHHWDWQLACVGCVEIPIVIMYMLGCYSLALSHSFAWTNSDILVLKFEIQVKWWEKIEMGLYCPTSRYQDCFLLHLGWTWAL